MYTPNLVNFKLTFIDIFVLPLPANISLHSNGAPSLDLIDLPPLISREIPGPSNVESDATSGAGGFHDPDLDLIVENGQEAKSDFSNSSGDENEEESLGSGRSALLDKLGKLDESAFLVLRRLPESEMKEIGADGFVKLQKSSIDMNEINRFVLLIFLFQKLVRSSHVTSVFENQVYLPSFRNAYFVFGQ
jgi:hypothetical protein